MPVADAHHKAVNSVQSAPFCASQENVPWRWEFLPTVRPNSVAASHVQLLSI